MVIAGLLNHLVLARVARHQDVHAQLVAQALLGVLRRRRGEKLVAVDQPDLEFPDLDHLDLRKHQCLVVVEIAPNDVNVRSEPAKLVELLPGDVSRAQDVLHLIRNEHPEKTNNEKGSSHPLFVSRHESSIDVKKQVFDWKQKQYRCVQSRAEQQKISCSKYEIIESSSDPLANKQKKNLKKAVIES